ncbi:restriction endonuclease subunit S [Cyanobium sp. FGCU-6]|nr:restriction endonuclease subunit S [Cyanobium sp. FGCU6]
MSEGVSWSAEPLGAICEIVSGITKDAKKQGHDYREVPYLRVANVQRLQLDLSEVKTIPVKESAIARYRLEPGDILLNEGGDRDKLGRGWIWQGQISECIHQNHVFRARIRDGKALPKWVAYYANTNEARAYFLATGKQTTNLASISKKNLSALPIPLPPIEIQESIITEIDTQLSRLDETVSTLQGIQAKLKQARASILKAAVEGRLTAKKSTHHLLAISRQDNPSALRRVDGTELGGRKDANVNEAWRVLEARLACESVESGTTPPKDRLSSHNDHNKIPFIKVYNLTFDGKLDFANNQPTYVEAEYHATKMKRSRTLPGDVLTNIVGPPLGKVSLVSGENAEWNINQAIARFRPTPELMPKFLAIYLRSSTAQAWLRATSKTTTSQVNLSISNCRLLPIPIPPLDKQQSIIAEVDHRFSVLDQVEATVQASLQRCGILRQAILKRAFEGRLGSAA